MICRQDQKSIANNKNYTDLATLKNGCHFTTATLSTLAAEYNEKTAAYRAAQGKLVSKIVDIAGMRTALLVIMHRLTCVGLVSFIYPDLGDMERRYRTFGRYCQFCARGGECA